MYAISRGTDRELDRIAGETAVRLLTLVANLVRDESGQDLVEYALLTGFFGLAGVASWAAIETGIATAYRGFDANSQSLWEPCDPGVSGACGQSSP